MSMVIAYVIRCDAQGCAATVEGVQRPAARKVGWRCDTRMGIDFCPDHVGSDHYHPHDRGPCAFCGKDLAILKNRKPHHHKVEGIECPGIHQEVARG